MAVVTNISATVRMSRQMADNSWVTVELGAEAAAVEGEEQPWTGQQAELFQDLKGQMAALFQEKTPPAVQAPDHPHTELPAAETRVHDGTGEVQHRCPNHKISKESKNGGLYCPGRLKNGEFCPWSYPAPARKAA